MSIQYPRPTPEGAWFIHWIDSDDEHQVTHIDGLAGPAPSHIRGEGVDIAARLYTPEHVGDDPGPVADHRRRYRILREIGNYAGDYSLFEPVAKPPLFQDSTPATAPSPLMGLEPSYDTAATDGFWALLDGYGDDTMLEDSLIEIDLSATMLATFEEYGPEELGTLRAEREYTGLTI